MNILITGSSGFIGSFLVKEALARGHRVVAGIRASSQTDFLRGLGVPLAVFDFSDPSSLQRDVEAQLRQHGPFDTVIHNAGITRARRPEDFYRVNDVHTRRFAEALIRAGGVPGRFVYISSLAAHGPAPLNGRAVESGSPAPITAYGKSKLAAELYLAKRRELPHLILRPAAVYGPRDKDFLQVYKMIRSGVVPYLVSSRQQLSMIHVEDLARAVFDAAEKAAPGATYFISDGQDYTIRDFNEAVRRRLNKRAVSVVLPKAVLLPLAFAMEKAAGMTGRTAAFSRERLQEFTSPNWRCDSGALQRSTGFRPKYDLESGLEHTLNWYKSAGLL